MKREITNYKGCTLISDPVIITLGLHEMDQNHSIYPNPSKERISIQVDDQNFCEAKILDITGKTVETVHFRNDISMDISQLNTGIYFLLVTNRQLRFVQKLIKQ